MEKNSENISKIKSTNFNDIDSSEGDFKIQIIPIDTEYIDSNFSEKKFELEQIDEVIICEEKTNLNGKFGLECELLVSNKNKADLVVDVTGNLLISGKGKERYEINEMGELIYKF